MRPSGKDSVPRGSALRSTRCRRDSLLDSTACPDHPDFDSCSRRQFTLWKALVHGVPFYGKRNPVSGNCIHPRRLCLSYLAHPVHWVLPGELIHARDLRQCQPFNFTADIPEFIVTGKATDDSSSSAREEHTERYAYLPVRDSSRLDPCRRVSLPPISGPHCNSSEFSRRLGDSSGRQLPADARRVSLLDSRRLSPG